MDIKLFTGSILLTGLVGGCIGYTLASAHYQSEMLKAYDSYKASVDTARTKEKEWQLLAMKKDEEYQKRISDMQSSNDELVDRLRKQLNDLTLRVSTTPQSSSKPHGSPRETNLSKSVGDLVEFSSKCSKRTDELIIQLESLQQWVKESHE